MALDLTVDGKKVFAATGGRPFDKTLPVLMFVHGASMNRTVWAAAGALLRPPRVCGHGRRPARPRQFRGPALATITEVGDWLPRLGRGRASRSAITDRPLHGHAGG